MWFSTFLWLNLVRRRARSLLTALGMAIAVGTSVALLGVAEQFERSTVESFAGRGVDIVILESGILDQLSSDLQQEYEAPLRSVQGVKDVGPGLLELIDYSHSGNVVSVLVQGWVPDSFLFDTIKIRAGRRFAAGEQGVVMLGKTLSEVLQKQVGDMLTIQRESFRVIGVYESFSVFENGAATLPLAELQRVMARPGGVTGFSVVLDRSGPQPANVEEVCRRIEDLSDESGNALGLSAVATQDYADNAAHLRVIRSMAWATSLIALVVGAVGTLNTMLMSVVERVREISILRAIGWRRGRVARMVLGECLLLSLAGAVIGISAAAGLLAWLSQLPMTRGFITGELPLAVIGKGLLLACAVAAVGGGYPAWRATRLIPVEGLSHE
ncbi:MAG: ABC transporter permease [Pirellulales bacterium]|nr:ABC transporter permease [Pirellulales bacterium]